MSTLTSRAEDRRKIVDIDAQIVELKALIQGLKAQKKAAWDRLQSYSYPVLTLPNEVVSEIFVHFLPAYPLCPPLSGLDSPTTLTHICHQWREIALATPPLWRALDLVESEDCDVPIIATWLARSGQLPLSIQCNDVFEMGPETSNIILSFRARWQYVLFYFSASQLETIRAPMPLLRQLEIRLPDPDLALSFGELPQLRSATLWDFDCPIGLLPWTQLTALTLICKAPSECTPILQLAVNLEYFELILWGEAHGEPDLKLASLNSLVFGRYSVDHPPCSGYLTSFITPALRNLRVHSSTLNPAPVQTLKSFIERSGCRLDSLCITGALDSQSPREVYLEAFPAMGVSFAPEVEEWSDPNEKARSRRMMMDFDSPAVDMHPFVR